MGWAQVETGSWGPDRLRGAIPQVAGKKEKENRVCFPVKINAYEQSMSTRR